MKTVLCRGPALTQSGYGVHTRQVARWLLSKENIKPEFQLLSWGDTPWILDSNSHGGLTEKIMKHSAPGTAHYDVTLQLQLPNEWDPKLGKFNVGITAAVETDRCHVDWTTACNTMNLVVVPSEHAKANLLSHNNISVPIIVIPESFNDSCSKSTDELPISALPTFSTPFNFLVFGQITGNNPYNDRKNTFFTLKWLMETFKDDPEVGIVLKTNAGRNSIIDRHVTTNMIKQVTSEVRSQSYPKIHLLHGDMTDDEVAALYKHPQIKALVSLTRGEGFGLPTLEAAASGLPVIATGWSGHMDFLSLGKFVNVYYQLSEVHKSRIDDRIFVKGSRWAEPSEEDFKKKITKFRSSFSTPKQWAIDLQQTIQKEFSFEKISKHYDTALGEML